MPNIRPAIPLPLAEALALDFQDDDFEGFDFEPYTEFMSEADTRSWLRAWTGNEDLDGREYLVFGQDGTGGYAAIWLKHEDRALTDQPIVFFGSEGNVGMVARNTYEFLWMLAGGVGPMEAVEFDGLAVEADILDSFRNVAMRHAASHEQTPDAALAAAKRAYPAFEADIRALTDY